MLYSKINVRTDERAIIIINEQLAGIRGAGKHTIWHTGKTFTYKINNMADLIVRWDNVQAALRFQREIAEQCWQIFDSNEENITIVWHKYLPAQIVPHGQSRAFWRPEPNSGDLQSYTLPKNEFWLSEHIQAALLQQNQLSGNLKKFTVKPHEQLVITQNGQLAKIVGAGEYVLFLPVDDSVEVIIFDTTQQLTVDWAGIDNILRFQRDEAEQHWHIVESPTGYDTIVWHEQFLSPQIIASGERCAFWKIADGQIQQCVIPQQAFELPQDITEQLLKLPALSTPLKKYTVKAHEKMLITVRGQLQRVYGEGEYLLRIPDDSVKILFSDSQLAKFDDIQSIQMWAKQQPELIAQHFDFIETSANELVLYSVGGMLTGWVAPDSCAYFWRHSARPYQIKHIDLTETLEISADIVAQLQAIQFRQTDFAQIIHTVEVPVQHQGLIYINQKLHTLLNTGNYYYWQLNQDIYSKVIDLRTQTCEISGQELLSEDKVTLRVNAVCNYRITDAPVWFNQHRHPDEFLYRELQFAIRAVIGGRSMDKLLAEKQFIDDELTKLMQSKPLHGIEIDSAGVKDIILPGEIRTILTKVVEAEKSAQANNIRRREETAATRSLLNTARVMEENPTALRLKELETLEKVTEKIDKISVYGGLDGVLKGLINIGNPKS